MDWSGVIGKLIGLGLPVLGNALGGPLGGAVATIIANALGTTVDPSSITTTIDRMPAEAAIQRLKTAEAEYVATVQAQADVAKVTSAQIGETMRAELSADAAGWFGFFQRGWRPAFAWELLGECTVMAFIMAHEVWTADFSTLQAMMQHEGFLTFYYGMRFGVIGVIGVGRSAEKVAAIKAQAGDSSSSLIDRVIQAVKQLR
jgi:hypothetical protein